MSLNTYRACYVCRRSLVFSRPPDRKRWKRVLPFVVSPACFFPSVAVMVWRPTPPVWMVVWPVYLESDRWFTFGPKAAVFPARSSVSWRSQTDLPPCVRCMRASRSEYMKHFKYLYQQRPVLYRILRAQARVANMRMLRARCRDGHCVAVIVEISCEHQRRLPRRQPPDPYIRRFVVLSTPRPLGVSVVLLLILAPAPSDVFFSFFFLVVAPPFRRHQIIVKSGTADWRGHIPSGR